MVTKTGSKKINVLIVGTGMFVCGRGTNNYGTILPAVMQEYKAGLLGNVLVASRHSASFKTFEAKLSRLRASLKTNFPYSPYPKKDHENPTAYHDAIRDLPDPGVVIIATPDHLHAEMALFAIKNGKHVLVVKPLATTVAEVYQLTHAAEQNGVYGAVEFHKRLDWANLRLRHAIENSIIGKPLYFHVEYSQRKMIPTQIFSDWVAHTSVFQYLGVHYADIIHFATGDRPTRIMATGQHGWLNNAKIPTYDAIQVVIEWSKGFVSTLLTNWIDPDCNTAMSYQMIKVIGTKGRFESDQKARGVQQVTDAGGVEDINPYFCQPYTESDNGYIEYRGYGIESITQFLRDVRTIVMENHSPRGFEGRRPTFRDALVSTAVIQGARLSLENDSKWVYFKKNLEPYVN